MLFVQGQSLKQIKSSMYRYTEHIIKVFTLFNITLINVFIYSTGLYLIFVLFLGATCTREVLKTDFMIAAKVSALCKSSLLYLLHRLLLNFMYYVTLLGRA